MNSYYNLTIEHLNRTHDKSKFRSGNDELDRYLHKQANQDIKRHISRVYVATISDNPDEMIGYYTLSSLSIELNHLPSKIARKLPKHPIPAALIGRLAVNKNAQGYGVGKMLLADAIKRIIAVSNEMGIFAVIVDAINKDAQCFYERFGFTSFSGEQNLRMFLALKAI